MAILEPFFIIFLAYSIDSPSMFYLWKYIMKLIPMSTYGRWMKKKLHQGILAMIIEYIKGVYMKLLNKLVIIRNIILHFESIIAKYNELSTHNKVF